MIINYIYSIFKLKLIQKVKGISGNVIEDYGKYIVAQI